MRWLVGVGLLAMAACNAPQDTNADKTRPSASTSAIAAPAAPDTPKSAATAPPTSASRQDEISPTMTALWDLPESELKTECSAADSYPGRQVKPSFYAYPSPPEFERYAKCLLTEAQRDGGRKRLASAGSFPAVGTCYDTTIAEIGTRFGDGSAQDTPNEEDGTRISFANRLYLVDYGLIAPVARSKVGDRVRTCVAALPEDCPAADLRGIMYSTTNMRTRDSWSMSDSQHMCRGA